ncbi:hypothetical protein TI04_13040 [Achromatium sp. WMS2]|nr:hypothetical protein TI04_13040 [Achromatium sp. WMS2]
MHADNHEILDRATHTIVQQVEAMKTMVNAFSDYARPINIQVQPIKIDSLIEDVTYLYRDNEDNEHIHVILQAQNAVIKGDSLRLRQILHNLIKNAEEATVNMEARNITIYTQSKTAEDQCCVEIRIQDNGPGFSRDIINNPFEPYVTTKIRGTGLGLAIVKKIVEEHGGIIWVENCSEGGACVTLRLPLMM